MRTLLFLLITWGTLGLVQCNGDAEACPDQIEKKIGELKRQPKQNPAAEIREYSYEGRKVYTITSACCDQFNYIYDECLNIICAPSGGITGRGDGRCPEFSGKATSEKLIWRDPR